MSRRHRRTSRATLALAALLLAPGARSQGWDDEALVFLGCSQVVDGALELRTCYAPGDTCDVSEARLAVAVPGTLTFDLHWDVTGVKEYSQFIVDTQAPGWAFLHQAPFLEDAWCAPQPCGGVVHDVTIPVVAGDLVDISLTNNGEPCLSGDDGLRCVLTNLRFTPTPGIHALGAGLDASVHYARAVPNHPLAPSGGLATLDDLDGDGVPELAVGVPHPSLDEDAAGRVRVLSGRTGALLRTHVGAPGGLLGHTVADARDVDGDGYGDLMAGEPGAANGKGAVHVWSGATGALLLSVSGAGQPASGLGLAIDGADDVDGDGRGDLLLGLPLLDGSAGNVGEARVVSGLTGETLFAFHGVNSYDSLGADVVGLGDVDGDGVPDVAASAYQSDSVGQNAGQVQVRSGVDGGLLYAIHGTPGEFFGEELAGAGDWDGDGTRDLVIGTWHAKGPTGLLSVGRVEVRSGTDGALLMARTGETSFQQFGQRVAGVGDTDGSGTDAVAVFDPANDRVLVFGFGQPARVVRSDTHGSLGRTMAALADLDGDGWHEFAALGDDGLGGDHLLVLTTRPEAQTPPTLAGAGFPLPSAPIVVSLGGGPAFGTAALVLGLHDVALPFHGGVLLPAPDLVLAGVPLDASGALSLLFNWPPELVAPVSVLVQAWIADPLAPTGLTASNGLALDAY